MPGILAVRRVVIEETIEAVDCGFALCAAIEAFCKSVVAVRQLRGRLVHGLDHQVGCIVSLLLFPKSGVKICFSKSSQVEWRKKGSK